MLRFLLVLNSILLVGAAPKAPQVKPSPQKPAPKNVVDDESNDVELDEYGRPITAKRKKIAVAKEGPKTHRFGVEVNLHALALGRSEKTELLPGYVLVNPNDTIVPPFVIDEVARFRVTYDYAIGNFNFGARTLFLTGGPGDLSWNEVRGNVYYTSEKNFGGFFIGPVAGIGTLRIKQSSMFSGKSAGNSLYAGVDTGYRYVIRKGIDIGPVLDVGYMKANYSQNGLRTDVSWTEVSLRILLGFAF